MSRNPPTKETLQTPVSATRPQADQPAPTQPEADRPPDLRAAGNLAVQELVKNIQAQIAPEPVAAAPASGPAPTTPQPVSIHWSESIPWLFTVEDDPAPSAISLELYGIDITPYQPLKPILGRQYAAEPELLRPQYRERLHQQVQSQLHDDVEELESLIMDDVIWDIPRGMEIIRRWACRGDLRAPSGRTYFDVFLGRLHDEYWYRDYLIATGAKHTFFDSMFDWAKGLAPEISILIGKNSREFGAYRPEWAKVEGAIQPLPQGAVAKPLATPQVVNAKLVTRTTDLILERLKGITFSSESHQIADLLINLPPPEQLAVLNEIKSHYDDRELLGLVGKYGEASPRGMMYWLFEDLEGAPSILEGMPKSPELTSLMLQFDRERLAQSLVTNGVITAEEAGEYVEGRGIISRTLPWTTGKISEMAEDRAKYWADQANRGNPMAYVWGPLVSLFDRQHIDSTILTIAGPKMFDGLGAVSPTAATIAGGAFTIGMVVQTAKTATHLILNYNEMSGAERLSSILELASTAIFFGVGRMQRRTSRAGEDPRALPSQTMAGKEPPGGGPVAAIDEPPAFRPPGLPGDVPPGSQVEWRIVDVNEQTGDITAVGRQGSEYGFIRLNIKTGDGVALHAGTGEAVPIRGGALMENPPALPGPVGPPSGTPTTPRGTIWNPPPGAPEPGVETAANEPTTQDQPSAAAETPPQKALPSGPVSVAEQTTRIQDLLARQKQVEKDLAQQKSNYGSAAKQIDILEPIKESGKASKAQQEALEKANDAYDRARKSEDALQKERQRIERDLADIRKHAVRAHNETEHESSVYERQVADHPGANVGKQITLDVKDVATGATKELKVDVGVFENGELKIVEAKFSEKDDLTAGKLRSGVYTENQNVAYRWISSGNQVEVIPRGANAQKMGLPVGEPIKVSPKVEVHVNSPEGIQVRDFKDTI